MTSVDRAARQAIGALFFINGFAFASWVSRIPAVQAALGLTPATLGAALAGLGAGSFVAMPLSGWLIARLGSRPVASGATLACCVAIVLPALGVNAPTLAIALALLGAVMGAMDVAMNAQGVELEHHLDRPIMATFHALFSLGGMAGAAVGGVIAARGVPVLAHFAAVALLVLTLAAVTLPWLLRVPTAAREASGRLRLSPALVGLSLLAAIFMIGEGAMADWTPVYLASVLGTGPGTAAAGYAVFSAAMTIGRLAGDKLTLRIGRVRLVRAGAALAALSLAAALLVARVPVALAGFFAVGLGFSAIIPLVFSAAGRLDARSAGPGLAAVTTAGYLGFLAGPPVLGFVADRVTLPFALGLVVLLALAGVALARYVAVDDARREP
jgi:predicted MFS family arabinose efflux permease